MGIGEAIKKGFSISKQSWSLILALFVFGAIWNIVSIFINPTPGAAPDTATTVRLVAVGLVFILVSVYVQAGSLGYICEKIKQGKADFSKFFELGGKFYVKILLLGLMIALIAGGLILLAALAIAALQGSLNALGIASAIFLTILGLYFAILLFLSPYIIVADNKGTIDAIKYSIGTVGKDMKPIIGILSMIFSLVIAILCIIPSIRESEFCRKNLIKILVILWVFIAIGFGIGVLLGLGFAALSASLPGQGSQIAFGIVSSFVNAYLGVVVTGSFMSLYLAIAHPSGSGTSATA